MSLRGPRIRDAVVREYSAIASHYEARWARYVEATTRATAERIDASKSGAILDVGCGTGLLLRLVQEKCPNARLVGVDLVDAMLRIAQPRLSDALLCRAAAEDLPFADGTIDSVVSSNVLHYFPSPTDALREMFRVLRPGGQCILTDWCDDYLTCRACDRILRLLNRAHVRTYRAAELRILARSAGFDDITIERYKIDWLWGLMTLRAARH